MEQPPKKPAIYVLLDGIIGLLFLPIGLAAVGLCLFILYHLVRILFANAF
jgi:hypothetical protein